MIPVFADVVEVDGSVGSVAGTANVAQLCKVVALRMLHPVPEVAKNCRLKFLLSMPTLYLYSD
jgi:hypothetical protein